ncbi:membrane protein insertase YidC [uncultured Ruminococcus sp.]|uniref:membrane protein insertase YidC n=1 Tax=uncultured Ruminococcus sp. TaxID=165186 RepID=UPI002624703D|nr:membrane protein insertase YidC [uncultured Ruminococcus sp.]
MSVLGTALGWIMSIIYNVVRNYGLSIIIFTLFTKVLLFPLSLLTQKNSINMVRMMPEENKLKIKYIDDKDKLADERLKLYKKYKYHPILGTVPLLIQIPLVLGLVYVIYRPLSFVLQIDSSVIDALEELMVNAFPDFNTADNTYQVEIIRKVKEGWELGSGEYGQAIKDIKELDMHFLGIDLSETPSLKHFDRLLLIPLFSGISAWLLCWVQNKINILQMAQGNVNKVLTTVFMVAFSTYFAVLVPTGVGLYWIFGNLFAIPMMMLTNLCMPPKKYIDYEYLEKVNKQRIEKEKIFKANSEREKEDYQKFFSVKGMKLMFYSEQNGFYKYYAGMIDYICEHSDIDIHYVTSDPDDNIFKDTRPQIKPYYIASNKRLIPLFMKLDCDMCVMTMPDLEKYHIKRSRLRKDVQYVYTFHGMGSTALTLRKGALDWYDTVFAVGPDCMNELRDSEELYNTPKKRIVETGYPIIDEMIEKYESTEHKANEVPQILIAPSWQPDNIIDSCIDNILEELAKTDYHIIVRPHPQQVRHEPEKFEVMTEKFKENKNIEIQTDFSSNNPVMESDILITDWSDISWEFAFVTKRPVLFINTPMKIMNTEWDKIKTKPINITLRNVIGVSLETNEIDKIGKTVGELLANKEQYRETITNTLHEHVYNVGKSRQLCGKYIVKSLGG